MNSIDPKGYKTSELAQSVDLDAYAIRDEAERRLTLVNRRLDRLYHEEAEAEKEQIELNRAIELAWKEIHK